MPTCSFCGSVHSSISWHRKSGETNRDELACVGSESTKYSKGCWDVDQTERDRRRRIYKQEREHDELWRLQSSTEGQLSSLRNELNELRAWKEGIEKAEKKKEEAIKLEKEERCAMSREETEQKERRERELAFYRILEDSLSQGWESEETLSRLACEVTDITRLKLFYSAVRGATIQKEINEIRQSELISEVLKAAIEKFKYDKDAHVVTAIKLILEKARADEVLSDHTAVRFDQLVENAHTFSDVRYTSLVKELSQLESRVGFTEAHVDYLQRRMDYTEVHIEKLGRCIIYLDEKVDQHGRQLDQVKGQVDYIGHRVTHVEGEMKKFGQRLNRAEENIDLVQENVQKVQIYAKRIDDNLRSFKKQYKKHLKRKAAASVVSSVVGVFTLGTMSGFVNAARDISDSIFDKIVDFTDSTHVLKAIHGSKAANSDLTEAFAEEKVQNWIDKPLEKAVSDKDISPEHIQIAAILKTSILFNAPDISDEPPPPPLSNTFVPAPPPLLTNATVPTPSIAPSTQDKVTFDELKSMLDLPEDSTEIIVDDYFMDMFQLKFEVDFASIDPKAEEVCRKKIDARSYGKIKKIHWDLFFQKFSKSGESNMSDFIKSLLNDGLA